MNVQSMTMVVIPEGEWLAIKETQQEILKRLRDIGSTSHGGAHSKYLTAKEFMAAVKIKRTKFDQLVNASKIQVIKKRRKIYVSVGEIDRYFQDSGIL